MTTRTASNASELTTALGASSAGDAIELQTGTFGSLTITNTFADPGITIRPATSNTPSITSVNCSGASWITFEDLSFIGGAQGDGGTGGPVKCTSGASNIVFDGCVARGPEQASYLGGYAVEFASGTDGCEFKNGLLGQYRIGYICISATNTYFGYNTFLDVGEDAIKGFGNNFTVEYNMFPQKYIGGSGDHPDGIQCNNSVTGGYIGHNILATAEGGIQGIFFGGGPSGQTHADITIEHNIVVCQLNLGIALKLNLGHTADNVVIRNNTVLFLTNPPNKKASYINWPGATVSKNVQVHNVNSGLTSTLSLRNDAPDGAFGVNNYYADIAQPVGSFLGFADFAPVGGSLVDPATEGVDAWGAHETIASWITNEQWPPTGSPAAPPEPEPGPAPNVPVVSGRTIILAASGLPLIG